MAPAKNSLNRSYQHVQQYCVGSLTCSASLFEVLLYPEIGLTGVAMLLDPGIALLGVIPMPTDSTSKAMGGLSRSSTFMCCKQHATFLSQQLQQRRRKDRGSNMQTSHVNSFRTRSKQDRGDTLQRGQDESSKLVLVGNVGNNYLLMRIQAAIAAAR